MSVITIYSNGTCTKCKGALELLQEKNVAHEVRWYMADPLTEDELRGLMMKLHLTPAEMVKKNEQLYIEHYQNANLSDDEWISVLLGSPELLIRPIVVKGDIAMIARPPEKLLEIL